MTEETNSTATNTIETQPNPKKKGPNLLIFGAAFLLLLPAIYMISIYLSIPSKDIQILKTGFVQVNKKVKSGPERFKITSKKPSHWKSLKDIPKTVIDPIVISEDWAFFEHEGVDFSQVKKAISENIMQGKKLRGASTISQQLVKNLFLSNERSFSRKLKEYFYVKELEKEVSKKKILELYLNVLHLGPNVYGVNMAAQYYFKKPLGQLSYREGAFLAMLLPSPVKYSESFRKGELSPFASEVIVSVLNKLVLAKKINQEQLEREQNRAFSWEKGGPGHSQNKALGSLPSKGQKPSGKSPSLDEIRRRGTDPLNRAGAQGQGGKQVVKATRKKFTDGSEYENRMRKDPDAQLDDNLTYDDDALIEDQSGFETEFNVE